MLSEMPVTAANPLEFTLPNGLRVAIVPAGSAPVATLMVVYKIGARNEAVGYTGSSHLLEHMLFKGTATNNRGNGRAFADIMNEIGAQKNATTWIDRTNYFETVPLEFLPLAIELEADRMRGALIPDDERRAEMTVVRNELERNDNSAVRVLNAALVATAFREHPYHHPTIGWRTDVEGVSTGRLRELYDTFYHPDNATVFVVGNVDVARTRDLVERHFGSLPRATMPIPDVHTSEPPQLGERSVRVKRPGDETLVAYAFHTPAAFGQTVTLSTSDLRARVASPRETNDTYALEVLSYVLGRGRASRLARSLVDTGIALEASSWNWGSRDPGLFQILVSAVPGTSSDAVRAETERVLERLTAEGPTAAELARARAQLLSARAFARDGTFALAGRLGEFEAVGDFHLDDDYVERIRAVDADAVRAVASAYLHEDNRTIGILEPGTPRTFASLASVPVSRRPDVATPVPMVALPVPESARVDRFADRIVRRTLGNGLVVSYVEIENGATLSVRGLFAGGSALAPERPMLPSVLADMLGRGTRSADRLTIAERLEGNGARRRYAVDDDRSHAYDAYAFRTTGASTIDGAATLFETLADELAEPAFDERELELVRAELGGALRLLRSNTNWRAANAFLRLAYAPGDPNAVADLDEMAADVATTTIEDLRASHARLLAGARPAIAAAGGLAADDFFALVERTIGAVPFRPAALVPTGPPRARAPRELREAIEIERKTNVDIVLGRATTLARGDADYVAAELANGILGQSTLSSRLGLRLRDREGLTYGVTSGFLGSTLVAGPWRAAIGVNPANVERAIDSIRAVLAEYVRDGPTARELVQQRNSFVGTQRVALATAAGISEQLERIERYDLGDAHVDTYRERVESASTEDVRAAIARYLSPTELIVVTAGTHARDA